MLIVAVCLSLALDSAVPAALDAEIRFDEVETLIRAERWSKAGRLLDKELRALVTVGGEMDGGDLMHAVRLRALIEAGRGADEKAEWWWHAGLNLQSEGSESVLDLVDARVAAKLRSIKVRPSRPPDKTARPKPGRDSQRPSRAGSSLFTLANQRLRGKVVFEIEIGPNGGLRKPLLMESTLPGVAVYAALESQVGVRFPIEWRRGLGEGSTITVQVNFRGGL